MPISSRFTPSHSRKRRESSRLFPRVIFAVGVVGSDSLTSSKIGGAKHRKVPEEGNRIQMELNRAEGSFPRLILLCCCRLAL